MTSVVSNPRHGPVLGVPKLVPARTDFKKIVQIFPLSTRAIAWDSTVECQFFRLNVLDTYPTFFFPDLFAC